MMKRIEYIDGTSVAIDNRDNTTTELRYADRPDVVFSVDTRFALEIVENALANRGETFEKEAEPHIKALSELLNKETS